MMCHVAFQELGFCTCNVATCLLERSAISQQLLIEARDQK